MTNPPQSTIDLILLKIGDIQSTLAVIDERTKAIGDHESRIRKLEAWKNGIPVAAILAIAGIIWQIVR